MQIPTKSVFIPSCARTYVWVKCISLMLESSLSRFFVFLFISSKIHVYQHSAFHAIPNKLSFPPPTQSVIAVYRPVKIKGIRNQKPSP